MSRFPGRDDAGQPIVAELGRAATPAEIAERKAANSARHRSNQTLLNLVVATLASLAIVGALVIVVVRPDAGSSRPDVDYAAAAASAQSAVAVPLAVPDLPEGWSANRAELVTGSSDGVTSWQVGLITPAGEYIALTQGVAANPTWVAGRLQGTPPADAVSIGGLDWTRYDRRDADDIGNLAAALVAETDGSTIVLAGTASDAELAVLAETVGEDLGA